MSRAGFQLQSKTITLEAGRGRGEWGEGDDGGLTRSEVQAKAASFGADRARWDVKRWGRGRGEGGDLMRKMSRLGSELNLSTRDWREAVDVEPSKRLQTEERERGRFRGKRVRWLPVAPALALDIHLDEREHLGAVGEHQRLSTSVSTEPEEKEGKGNDLVEVWAEVREQAVESLHLAAHFDAAPGEDGGGEHGPPKLYEVGVSESRASKLVGFAVAIVVGVVSVLLQ
jgi:hypothetical protein